MYKAPRGEQHGSRGSGVALTSSCSADQTGVDNYAHAGGFAGGYLAGMWLDPLKRERMDHFVWAAACLAITGLSILASIITGLKYI